MGEPKQTFDCPAPAAVLADLEVIAMTGGESAPGAREGGCDGERYTG